VMMMTSTQASRFNPDNELALVWKWPREYSVRFRTDKAVFLLGACVTETDKQFYSPRVRYYLRMTDPALPPKERLVAEGGDTFMKRRAGSGRMEFGPHDVAFK